jgi:hypothetical protein
MSPETVTPYRSCQPPGRDGFPHLLRSGWAKFGWAAG